MRGLLVIVHRWAGLFIAVFLFIAGLTGSLISWDHELDEWLNPDLFEAKQTGTPLPPLELVSRFEAENPHARVTYFPLAYEQGKTADLFVQPRINSSTGRLYDLDYNQAYVDPATGEVTGKRFWGRISLDRRDILPFLYKLHYSMHIPDFYGIDHWGIWLMGIVGVVWLFDCFVGLWLTFPTIKRVPIGAYANTAMLGGRGPGGKAPGSKNWFTRWAPAWRIKSNASAYRLNFDLHRAAGLWAWLFLLILAFTSISMNLGDEVVRPALAKVFSLTPEVSDSRTPAPFDKPILAKFSFASILNLASEEASKRSWQEPLGSTFYDQQTGIYSVSFYDVGGEHGSGGMGTKTLYLDGNSGAVLGDSVPWAGTAADIFMQLQFPLHSGRIAGLPGRILLSIMGIVVALLSFTGIVIWFKKRLARTRAVGSKELSLSASRAGRGFYPTAPTTPGRFAAALYGLACEERLRARLTRLGQTATGMGAAPGPLSLGRAAVLSCEALVPIISAGIIGVKRSSRQIWLLAKLVWRTSRDLAALIFTRGFWEGGKTDAGIYARHIASHATRLAERSLTVANWLLSRLASLSWRT